MDDDDKELKEKIDNLGHKNKVSKRFCSEIECSIKHLLNSDNISVLDFEKLFTDFEPILSKSFIKYFLNCIINNELKKADFLQIIDYIAKTKENNEALYQYGALEILISFVPHTFETLYNILINAGIKSRKWFVIIGGLYSLTHYCFNEDYILIISKILNEISDVDIDYINEIKPPHSDLFDIKYKKCEKPLYFSMIIRAIMNSKDVESKINLLHALYNFFQNNEEMLLDIGKTILAEAPSLINNQNLCKIMLKLVKIYIPVAECDDPTPIADMLLSILNNESQELMLTTLDVVNELLESYSQQLFHNSSIITCITNIITKGTFQAKLRAIDILLNMTEEWMKNNDTTSLGLFIDNELLSIICECARDMEEDHAIYIMDKLLDLLSWYIMLNDDDKNIKMLRNGIKELYSFCSTWSIGTSAKAQEFACSLEMLYEEI